MKIQKEKKLTEERFKKKTWTYQTGLKDLTGSEKYQSKFNQETILNLCTLNSARTKVHEQSNSKILYSTFFGVVKIVICW